MTRTTRNISIGLVGSALMATCCITSGCLDTPEERAAYARNTGTVHHRSRPFWPRYYWWSTPRYSYSRPGVGSTYSHGSGDHASSGASHSSSHGTTGRGGFGSTGHATTGG